MQLTNVITIDSNRSRPHVDSLKGTGKVKNLKELRVQHKGRPYRVFFAFDPLRQAVMLCGGDKTCNKHFYETMNPIAECEFLNFFDSTTIVFLTDIMIKMSQKLTLAFAGKR